MNPSLVYSHQTQKKIIFWTDALVAICLSQRDLGTQRAISLRIPNRSCEIVETLPCEMPNACAVSSTWIRLSEYTRSRTFLHISSSVAPIGRPDLASSSKDVLPRLNSPTQNLTWAYDGAEDPLTARLGGSVGCASDWRPGGRGFNPRRGRQHSFMEIDHEIFSAVILSRWFKKGSCQFLAKECAQYWLTA